MHKNAISRRVLGGLITGTAAGTAIGTAAAFTSQSAKPIEQAGVILLAAACGALGGSTGGYLIDKMVGTKQASLYKKAVSERFARSLATGTVVGAGAGTAYALTSKATPAQKVGLILLATAGGALGGAAGGYLVDSLLSR